MKNRALILFISIFSLTCNTIKQQDETIYGNWHFCNEYGKYNELYISDSYFQVSFENGRLNYALYPIIESDSIFLYKDLNKTDLWFKGNYHFNSDTLFMNLKGMKFKSVNKMKLSRLEEPIILFPQSSYSDYDEWWNKEFEPAFIKRKEKNRCSNFNSGIENDTIPKGELMDIDLDTIPI